MLAWIALSVFVFAALAFDLRSGARTGQPSMRSALVWSVVWTAIGVAFGAVVAAFGSGEQAGEYLAGFLIEKSLSLDNLFVFAVLFTFFAVPSEDRKRVLIFGIVGAIILRAIFIVAGAAVLDAVHAATYVLGALLALTAIKIARHGGEEMEPDKTVVMKIVRKVLPENASPLMAPLVAVALFDVMFAIDSIPAIFAVTRETFIVFAANAFSLLGMVSLFFLLDDLLARFRYLNLGLAAILGYVAAKLILVDVWHPPIALSLAVVAGSLVVAALASVVVERREAAAVPPPEPERA